MREIKFRAWHDQDKVMLNKVSQFSLDEIARSSWEWMQYTGLKDRHGKEIFEGDIVKTNGVDGKLLWCVIWTELDVLTGFDYEPINHTWSSVHNDVDETGEVIGNIYENPGLLAKEESDV